MFVPLTRRTGTYQIYLTYTRNTRVSAMSATPFASAKPRCWRLIPLGTLKPRSRHVPQGEGCESARLLSGQGGFSISWAVWPLRVEVPSVSRPSVVAFGWFSPCERNGLVGLQDHFIVHGQDGADAFAGEGKS